MAKRLAKSAKENPSYNSLLMAVELAYSIQDRNGLEYEKFCLIKDGWLYASNSKGISVGIPLEGIDIEAAPNTEKLLKALRTESEFSLTVEPNKHIVLRGQKLKAVINCIPTDDLPHPQPTAIIGEYENCFFAEDAPTFCEAIGIAAEFSGEFSLSSNFPACVQILDGLASATDRYIAIQVYHGGQSPEVVLPAEFCQLAKRLPFEFQCFIGDGKSATIYFANGLWIKTSIVPKNYPDLNKVLPWDDCEDEIPEEFYAALTALESFADNKRIHFCGDCLATVPGADTNYELATFERGCFNVEYLQRMKGIATKYYIQEDGRQLYFFGNKLRGAIMGMAG